MKHILVIGGAGYIGSACVQALCNKGYSVTVFDNLRTGQRDKVDPRAHFIEGSILDKNALRAVVESQPFTTAIHLAALKAVGESEEHPDEYFETNVSGTINVLTALAASNVPRIVFSSTAAVYRPNESAVLDEDSPCAPMSVYGTTKLLAEQCIQEFVRTKKMQSYAILRYFNVAGDAGLHYSEKNPQNVFPLLAQSVQLGTPFSVFGTDYPTRDGTCVRDYIHLLDLVDAHIRAIESPFSAILNICTTSGVTVRELVHTFEEVSGRTMSIVEAPRRAGDPAQVIASSDRAKKLLGWEARHTLREMVESTLASTTL